VLLRRGSAFPNAASGLWWQMSSGNRSIHAETDWKREESFAPITPVVVIKSFTFSLLQYVSLHVPFFFFSFSLLLPDG